MTRRRPTVSDDAFEAPSLQTHHVTNPMIKAKPVKAENEGVARMVVRMQVSFVLPDDMESKGQAVKFVLGAIQDAVDAAELPALEELQVLPFKTGFKV